ncbi:hypothetical protein ABZ799_26725 [Nocardiopsis dassonvillei]|uniref:hypothetical protein n=1 Tax=Nocardiopsis dassonvillei TaxID=2014 RepID=UPI0033DBEC25
MSDYGEQYRDSMRMADRISTTAADKAMDGEHELASALAAAAHVQATLALAAATMAASRD